MQLKMMNILNRVLYEKKKLLNDEKVCEHCGMCHSELEECAELDEQSTTAGIAMGNPPLELKESLKSIEETQLEYANELLEEVVDLWGREYGRGKKYSETTLGGKLIEKIKKWLALHNW